MNEWVNAILPAPLPGTALTPSPEPVLLPPTHCFWSSFQKAPGLIFLPKTWHHKVWSRLLRPVRLLMTWVSPASVTLNPMAPVATLSLLPARLSTPFPFQCLSSPVPPPGMAFPLHEGSFLGQRPWLRFKRPSLPRLPQHTPLPLSGPSSHPWIPAGDRPGPSWLPPQGNQLVVPVLAQRGATDH